MNTIDPADDSPPVLLPPWDTPDVLARRPVHRFDDGIASPNGRERALDVRAETAARANASRLAAWGLASVLVLSGYEWLLSGLDKLFSADFRGGLADELGDAMDGNPNQWYVRFLANDVIPHARAFATVVEWGEIFVALGLFLGAVAWIGGNRLPRRWMQAFQIASCGALVGSAFMTANYYLLAGNRFPWLNTAAPFDEGLSIDGLMTLVALALLAIQALATRASFAGRSSARVSAPYPSRARSVHQAA
jgi:hypothetical protein